MSKRGLPTGIKMRHDSHYVEELARTNRSVGRVIPINKIEPNARQPRVEIGDLTELKSSIEQNGVLEPLLVKPRGDGTYMIIAGERRWRAANLAGLTEVPCIELDIDEKSIAEIALIENLQRKDLTVWEEADGLAYLGSRFSYTHEEIAKKIGKSRTTVTESMAIAGLPESIRQKCRDANVNAKSTLLEIARQFDENAMHEYLGQIAEREKSAKNFRPKTSKSEKSAFKENIKTTRGKNDANDAAENISSKKVNKNNIFRYESRGNNFNLEIQFNKTAEFQKKNVLRALKEAFDSVKGSTE